MSRARSQSLRDLADSKMTAKETVATLVGGIALAAAAVVAVFLLVVWLSAH